MNVLKKIRVPTAVLLAVGSAIEIGTSLYVAVVGPFAIQLGPISLLGTKPVQTLTIGVLLGCAAAWLSGRPGFVTESRAAALSRWVALVAICISFASLIGPIFARDFMRGHDAAVHSTYVFLFDRAIAVGQFPVRWTEGISNGLGQPLFNYYQVGFFYLVELFHSFGPGLSLSMKLAVAAMWAAGGLFMFLWLSPLGVLPAALGSLVFVWSPYLALDGYVRTAYPELMAISLAPGILWSIDRWFRTGRSVYICAIALMTALMTISHLATTVIIAPLCVAFTLAHWIAGRRPVKQVAAAAAGALLGSSMAAFYLWPAIFELDHVKIGDLTSLYFDYHRHFVRPQWWLDQIWSARGSGLTSGHMSLQLGVVQWTALALAIAVIAVPRARKRAGPKVLALCGCLAVTSVALFMMTSRSARIWEAIGPLEFLQFPWRLLMVPALACGALAALLLSLVRLRTTRAIIVVCVVAVQWYAMRDARSMASSSRLEMPIDDPSWPSTENARKLAFHELGFDPSAVVGVPLPTAERWTIADGRGQVVPDSISDIALTLSVRADEPLRLVINSPYFPGWVISVDQRSTTPTIQPTSGYMEILVPPGSHRVDARLENTDLRAAANHVTAAGLGVWLMLAVGSARGYRRRRGETPGIEGQDGRSPG